MKNINKMKVRCIKVEIWFSYITLDKIYEVEKRRDINTYILKDIGVYSKKYFERVYSIEEIKNGKFAVEIDNEKDWEKLKINGLNNCSQYWKDGIYYDTGYASLNYYKNNNYTIIKFNQIEFMEEFLNREKKIIGYKLFDLWFEPIFEEEFKVGNYITVTKEKTGYCGELGKTYKIIKINGDSLNYVDGDAISKKEVGIRLATEEEIKAAQQIELTIGGKFTKVIITKNKILAEGKEITIEGLKNVLENFKPNYYPGIPWDVNFIDCVKIGCSVFDKKDLQQVVDIYNSLQEK